MRGSKRKNITHTGDKFGLLTVIKELGNIPKEGGTSVYYSLCKCECGREVKIRNGHLFSGYYQSCGCKRNSGVFSYKHGLIHHPLYRLFHSIKNRCYNPHLVCFKYYGGRGITMCKEWLTDVTVFINYCQTLPHCGEKGYSIDRIDTNGNYEPFNIRFADKHTQMANKRKVESLSGYTGAWITEHGRFQSNITINGNTVYLGTYKTAQEAATIRNNYIKENNLKEYPIQKIS